MSELLELQQAFVRLQAEFQLWAYAQGYALTYSEAWRSEEEAELQAQRGAGIVHSLHCERLAIDLNLFRDGRLLTSKEDYAPLGEKWKSLHSLARWGGDFKRVDVDHFSLAYGGME